MPQAPSGGQVMGGLVWPPPLPQPLSYKGRGGRPAVFEAACSQPTQQNMRCMRHLPVWRVFQGQTGLQAAPDGRVRKQRMLTPETIPRTRSGRVRWGCGT